MPERLFGVLFRWSLQNHQLYPLLRVILSLPLGLARRVILLSALVPNRICGATPPKRFDSTRG